MVSGKVRVTMGFHKSPSTKPKDMPSPLPLPLPPPPLKPPSGSAGKPGFTRSFGVYFPRASAQVHAASSRAPDQNGVVLELRRQVEELKERETLLKTEVLEVKLLKESVSVIPLLESLIEKKNGEIEVSRKETARLAEENVRLRRKSEEMEAEMVELRKLVSSSLRESEDHALSVSQRFQGLMDVSAKSNLIRSLKRVGSMRSIHYPVPNQENKTIAPDDGDGDNFRKDEIESNSEELTESSLSTVRSRVPRVPNPPPKRSFSSNVLINPTENRANPPSSRKNPPPPPPPPPQTPFLHQPPPQSVSKALPPPPPPPPPKSLNTASAKVRRVPEVVEFYHSYEKRLHKFEKRFHRW